MNAQLHAAAALSLGEELTVLVEQEKG